MPKFDGEFYWYEGLKFSPKPLQKPYPPILIGGSSPAAMRRIVQYGDGWHTLRQSPDEVAAGHETLSSMMKQGGRDPAVLQVSISSALQFDETSNTRPPGERRSLGGTEGDIATTLQAYAAAGVQEVVVSIASTDPAFHEAQLTRLMTQVAPKV